MDLPRHATEWTWEWQSTKKSSHWHYSCLWRNLRAPATSQLAGVCREVFFWEAMTLTWKYLVLQRHVYGIPRAFIHSCSQSTAPSAFLLIKSVAGHGFGWSNLVLDPMHQTNMEMFVLKATNSCRSVSGSFSNRDLVSYRGWLIRMWLWHCNQFFFFAWFHFSVHKCCLTTKQARTFWFWLLPSSQCLLNASIFCRCGVRDGRVLFCFCFNSLKLS